MTQRTTSLLLKGMLDFNDAYFLKLFRGKTKATHFRNLASCGVLATRRTPLPPCPDSPMTTPHRGFINLAAPITTRRIEYSESRTLQYTPEQMYNVVANVEKYQYFVPWCTKSKMKKSARGDLLAELQIGFPPIVESYTSEVTLVPNHQVKAVCTDGSLFSHLETVWRFAPSSKDLPGSCDVNFYVSFEFKSLLHSQLATMFMDEVVKQMVRAFESRATELYKSPAEVLRRRSALGNTL